MGREGRKQKETNILRAPTVCQYFVAKNSQPLEVGFSIHILKMRLKSSQASSGQL